MGLSRDEAWSHLCSWTETDSLRKHARAVEIVMRAAAARYGDGAAHAVSAHYTKWGVPYETALDKALLACDELTGFVVACCLVRPEGVATLTPKSVKKKLKDKRFAAKVERAEVYAGVEKLGVDLGAHVQLVIDALKPHADELGIAGSG